jgi:hypothetical protein
MLLLLLLLRRAPRSDARWLKLAALVVARCALCTCTIQHITRPGSSVGLPAVTCCFMQLGDKATFAWQYTGLDTGRYSCTIEGSSTVSLAGPCSSPLTYTVRTTLNQTLAVSYEDVCHAQHNASLTFGPGFGWEVEAKELGESPPLHTLSSSGSGGGGGPATLLRTNGGGATRPPTARKLLAALAGALLVGALLL